MVDSAEGTKALALELCREFEDKFLQHITSGEVSSFTGCLPFCFFIKLRKMLQNVLGLSAVFRHDEQFYLRFYVVV